MRSYFAKQGCVINAGGWLSVLIWARGAIKQSSTPVQLLSVRGGEISAKIIAEVSRDGERIISHGRIINVKALLRFNY